MKRAVLMALAMTAAGGLAIAQTPPKTAATPAPSGAGKPTAAKAATPPLTPIAAPGRTLLSTKDVMKHIVNPAAETFWAHSGVVDDEKGANDRTPQDEANWKLSLDSAAQLVEAGNLLQMEGRARDPDGPWMKYAVQLTKAGLAGMAAAQAKDHDKTFDAGSAMYDACYACHGKYIPRPKDSLYKHDIDKDLEAAGLPKK